MNNEEKNLIEMMIQAGQDLNEPIDEYGTTPLLLVCNEAQLELVQKLIEHGADVNQAENEGMTPLMVACEAETDVESILEVIAVLVEAGADINAMSKDGITPLFLAACWDTDELMQALVDNGASVDRALQGAKMYQQHATEDAQEVLEVVERLKSLK